MNIQVDPNTGLPIITTNEKHIYGGGSLNGVKSVVAGTNVTVDNTDPKNPVVSSTGSGGTTDHAALSNLDYASAGHTGFQPAGSYLTDISSQDLSTADNTTSAFITSSSLPTSVDTLGPSQTGNNGKYLTTDGTNASWAALAGGGDMSAATYDPTAVSGDAFSMGNMAETATKKILSDTERTAITTNSAKVGITPTQASDITTNNAKLTADTTNVTAAGALMDSEVTNLAQVKAFSSADYATAAQGSLADSALQNVVEDTTPQLGGALDARGNNIIDLADVTFKTGVVGGTVRTGVSAADKFELQGYKTGVGAGYQKMLEVDAGTSPTLEVFSNSFGIWDGTDETKHLNFDVSAITTGTNRTLTMPDANVNLGDIATNNAKISFDSTSSTRLANTSGTNTGDNAGVTSVGATAPVASSGGNTPTISMPAATSLANGYATSIQITKLDGIATGATANSTDATLLARANHTGTQLASTISDFSTATAATSAVTANTAKVTNATHTGDVTGATALTIANNAVTNAKMATMLTKTYKGNTSGVTAVPTDVPVATLKTDLGLVKGDVGLGNVDNTSDATKNSATATLTNKTLTTPTIAQINNSTAPGVKLQLRTQTDNSDTVSSATTAGVYVQYGWGQVVGNGTATIAETVTLPTAFTTPLGVQVTLLGAKVGVATDVTGLNLNLTGAIGYTYGADSLTTTNFRATLNRNTGTFGATVYYGYAWVAWGV